jgi:hypothetical protein
MAGPIESATEPSATIVDVGAEQRLLFHSQAWTRLLARLQPLLPDVLLAGVLMAAATAGVAVGLTELYPHIAHRSTWDFWFESDPPGVAEQLLDRWTSIHVRNHHHPVFSLLISSPAYILRKFGQIQPETALALVLGAAAAICIGMFYAGVRSLGLRRIDATVFSALATVSSYAVFWFPVPESFGFGAVTIVSTVGITAVFERSKWVMPLWGYVVISAATLGITTTNWMSGLSVLLVKLDRKRAFIAAASSVALVVLLWWVQKLLYPFAGHPFTGMSLADVPYVLSNESIGLLAKLRAFFFHSIVLPELGIRQGFRLSVQAMGIGSGTFLAGLAAGLWAVLLMLGVWKLVSLRSSKAVQVLMLTLCGQLALHIVFGLETFLYSAHYGPLLVIVAALGALTPMRRFVVATAAVLTVLAGVNNLVKFGEATSQLRANYESERRFIGRFAELTEPNELVACGTVSSATIARDWRLRFEAETAPVVDLMPEEYSPWGVCAASYAETPLQRRGWVLFFESWSVDTIETLRQRGARYFVTPYGFGVQQKRELFDVLDTRFRRIERTPGWAFYDLRH